MNVLLVALGALVAAPLRFLTDRANNSTFSYETFALIEGRDRLIGVANVVGVVGLAAATGGCVLPRGFRRHARTR
jgi:fluoride ion exporter CrcB/FEX